ncbi:P110/LppT family adhesin N-terminal domain [Mesomycoplasma ovipneumoniae]|uniref:P110/LppT family adhesin N-terminal domain n=1 Tax=Mesomycoplasma ovipneumoniae TaxID=29562 RepID=UPI0029654C97|nr:P110/LppT family adhesin N-terminal domain [Mesomycoplasma ovipneumoniae]MDW2862064.1 P110/LppT family adhesin N-terminal domain [Mesomycoplasma ovipneumoniae]
MKNIKRKNLLIASSIVFLSAVISVGIAVPIGKNAYYKNQSEQLLKYSDQKSDAKSFVFNSKNQQEILQSVSQLNLKAQFADTLTAKNAVDLYFDKTYSFDLNSLVDFKPLENKFPGFSFKLLVPKDKKDLKIENNTLSNLAINVQNQQQNINYNVKFDLKFSADVKNSEVDPDNVNVVLELVNDELIKDKTASEIAILFNSKFIQNKKSSSDQQALLKTIAEFGSVSFFNKQTNDLILPLAFDLEPNLKDSKLFFSKVDDATGQTNLDLSLVEKYSKKKSKIALEFKNLSTINESYASKFAQIFKDNYIFNDEIAKFLASSNLTPLDLISKPLPDSAKNQSIFKDHQPSSLDFWFKQPKSPSQVVPETPAPDSATSESSSADSIASTPDSSSSDSVASDASASSSAAPAAAQPVSVSTLADNPKTPQQQDDASSESGEGTANNSENSTTTQPTNTESTNEEASKTESQESKTEETPSQKPQKVETREEKLKKSFSEILHNFQISEFKIQPVKIELSKEDQADPIKKQAIPLRLTLNGNFVSSESFPGGLNFNSNNELEYSFNFNYDISDEVYGVYFQNALDSATKTEQGGQSSLKIENLEFEIKSDQKISVFAQTIDQTIEHIKNKKIELTNLKSETKQLFDLLDFVAKTKPQPITNTNQSTTEETQPVEVKVASVDSIDPSEQQKRKRRRKKKPKKPAVKKVANEAKTNEDAQNIEQVQHAQQIQVSQISSPGKLLTQIFDNLLESNLPKTTAVILDSKFEKNTYQLLIGIWLGDEKLKEIKIPIVNVLKDNKPFEFLKEETKLHFFIDAESLITENSGPTTIPAGQTSSPNENQIPISSIKSIDSQKLEFKDYDDQKNPVQSGHKSKLKPYLDLSQGGIFLSHDGLKLDLSTKKDAIKNPTFALAFKSAQNFSTSQSPFYLVQGWKEDKSGSPYSYGDEQKIDFGIKIRRYNYDKDKINNLEVQIGDETANQGKNVQKIDHHTALVDTVTEKPQGGRTNTQTIVDKVSESKNKFTPGVADYLDNKQATSFVVFRLLDATETTKKVMELTLYSSMNSDPYEPVFSVKKIVDLSSFNFSDIKYYILGKLATQGISFSGTSGAVLLKSAAVFESVENEDKSKLINKLFIDRYFGLDES